MSEAKAQMAAESPQHPLYRILRRIAITFSKDAMVDASNDVAGTADLYNVRKSDGGDDCWR